MIFKFLKTFKVLKEFEYRRIFKHGHFKSGHYVLVQFLFSHSSSPKLGITVTKKFGKAHERNRFKRVVREAFRLCRHDLPEHIEMNVRPGPKADLADPSLIKKELMELTQGYDKTTPLFRRVPAATASNQSQASELGTKKSSAHH